MDYSKIDPLKDAIRSNYAHGKLLIKARDDYKYGKITYEDYKNKMIYHKEVIKEQTRMGAPIDNSFLFVLLYLCR